MQLLLPLGYEPSGAVWHQRLNKLFIISDGGIVSALDADGSNVQNWSVPGDLEGICIADPATNIVYVANEVPARVIEFNFVTGQVTRTFDLSPWMPTPPNSGMEGLTFVPSATDPEGGIFYGGHQDNGKIYKFRLPIRSSQTSTTVTYLGNVTPVPGRVDIADLCFDRDNNVLYILYDNSDVIRAVNLDMSLIEEWFVPGIQQEGIAVKPPCDVFIADDVGLLTRYTGFPSGDFDHDGVPNCDDLCPGTPAGQQVGANGCSCSLMPGDVNGDNHIDGNDLQIFMNLVVNSDSASPDVRCAADLDGNGRIDAADVQRFKSLLLSSLMFPK